MFEDEYRQVELYPLRIEYLLKDASMLFPPTTTPLSGVEFIKRLPSGDIERARRVNRIEEEKRRDWQCFLLVDSCVFSHSSIVLSIEFYP